MENSLIRNFHLYPNKIPKYRVENRRNTETAFMIGHAYVKLYLSRIKVCLSSMNVYTTINSAIARKRSLRSRIYHYNDRKAWSLYATTISLWINYHLLNLYSLHWFALHIVLTCFRQVSANKWYRNTVKDQSSFTEYRQPKGWKTAYLRATGNDL